MKSIVTRLTSAYKAVAIWGFAPLLIAFWVVVSGKLEYMDPITLNRLFGCLIGVIIVIWLLAPAKPKASENTKEES